MSKQQLIRGTNKDHGLVMVQTKEDEQTNRQTDRRMDATKRIISPASRLIKMERFWYQKLGTLVPRGLNVKKKPPKSSYR